MYRYKMKMFFSNGSEFLAFVGVVGVEVVIGA